MDSQHLQSPPVCVCVLCGLPAAGKSTLARTVTNLAAERGWRSTVMHYDELIPQYAFDVKVLEDNMQAVNVLYFLDVLHQYACALFSISFNQMCSV